MAGRASPRTPRTRAERQRETREALMLAALDAFSRDGYHATSLEGIANEAGFSKGAVYSNFTGKPDLFLTLMEFNLKSLRDGGWDPFSMADTGSVGQAGAAGDAESVGDAGPVADAEPVDDAAPADNAGPAADADLKTQGGLQVAEMMRGFGLATLEFIATAAREEKLMPALRERMQMMVDAYTRVATSARPADDSLSPDDVALLMTALDQGVTMLALSGITPMDPAVVRAGLRRLVDPAGAAADPAPEREGAASFPGVEQVERLFRELPGD